MTISTSAESAREGSRQGDGKFGEQHKGAADPNGFPPTADEKLTDEQFLERFGGTVDSPDRSDHWEDNPADHGIPANRIWSKRGGDWDSQSLEPGTVVVNHEGWVVTNKPHDGFEGWVEYFAPQCEACREEADYEALEANDGICSDCVNGNYLYIVSVAEPQPHGKRYGYRAENEREALGQHNVAHPNEKIAGVSKVWERENDEDTCAVDDCDESLDDGEGYDGYCGEHADLIEQHLQGEHKGDDSREGECPNCDGANVQWV